MPIKLVVNAIPLLGEQSGVGKYTREIITRLATQSSAFQYTYYYGYYSRSIPSEVETPSNRTFISGLKEFVCRHALLKRACRKAVRLTSPLLAGRHDLYFEPNFTFQPGIRARIKVVTVHDFSCFLHPEWHPAERVRHMDQYMWSSLKQADRIIAVSEAMRKEAIQRFGLDCARIVTIPNGVDLERYSLPDENAVHLLRKKWDLPESFVLFVGTLEPRKNLKNLLLAYDALPETLQKRFPLILVGCSGWNNAELHAILESMPQVRRLGFVPETELPTLYGAASLMVYPSWYEGFGLPVLEAMACGCPVLTSDHAALREVGGDAVRCVQPGDVDGLCATMTEILENGALQKQMRRAGIPRAALFNWDESARKHGELFRTLCMA